MGTPLLNLRVDAVTKARWQARAQRSGKSLSGWLRDLAEADCVPHDPTTATTPAPSSTTATTVDHDDQRPPTIRLHPVPPTLSGLSSRGPR